MVSIVIKTGKFEGQKWGLNYNELVTGTYMIKKLPLTKLTNLNKKEEVDKLVYVDFSFSNGINFTASMKPKVYAKIYDFHLRNSNINNAFVAISKKEKIQKAWEKGELISKPSFLTYFLGISFTIFFLLILLGKATGLSDTREYSSSEKAKLCKAFISELFYKPVSIISNYKNSKGIPYVRYTRQDDNQTFSYACQISNNKMLWSAYLNDTQEWGRWRYEDEVKLNYNKENNSTSFTRTDINKKIEVKL